MVKPEWGAKRACPKCNTRFYDLTKDDPVTCINCGFAWVPEPVLKSKQTTPFEQAKVVEGVGADVVAADADADVDLDLEAAEDGDAPDVDLGDDEEDLNSVVPGEDNEDR